METLCSACAEIFTGGEDRKKDPGPYAPERRVRYLHHDCFADFQAGLRVECLFCEMLKTAYVNEHGDFSEEMQQGTVPFKITYIWETDVEWLYNEEEEEEEEEQGANRKTEGVSVNLKNLGPGRNDANEIGDAEKEDNDARSVVEDSGDIFRNIHILFISYWLGDNDEVIKDFWLFPTFPIQDLSGDIADHGLRMKVYNHKLDDNTGSESCRALMEYWVDHCVKHDPCVLPSPETVRLPTRVIDVGNQGEDLVSLHITERSTVQTGRYMTLSHRWGQANLPKCTKAKLEELQKGIEVSVLPKTFRDAIDVTRSFGVRFLWIDSLCIIQDSDEDWAQEAGMMGEVYRNCFVNIAATAAKDSDGGLFFQRRVRDAEHLEVEIDWLAEPGDRGTTSYARVSCGCWDPDLWNFEIELAVVNTRGWVAQERLFSPRIIHFGRNQLWWECAAGSACEMSPGGDPDLSAGPALRPWKHLSDYLDAPEQTPIGPMIKKQRYRRWCVWWDFVEAYTMRDFTFTSDKLIAISAVAQAMIRQHAAVKDDYLAGLWRWWLELDLHWYVFYDERMPSPKKTYRPNSNDAWRVPSWSWASVDGPVKRLPTSRNEKMTVLFRLLSAEILPKYEEDTTGQLRAASLTLECSMFFLEWLILGHSNASFDNAKMKSSDGSRAISGRLFFDHFDLASAMTGKDGVRVLCLPGMSASERSSDLGEDAVYGLVVEAVPHVDHHYRRIGHFAVRTTADELYMFVKDENFENLGQIQITLI